MDRRKSSNRDSVTNLGTINVDQYEANQRLAMANERKEKVLEVLPTFKKGVSGWTTSGYKESSLPDCPGGAEAITFSDYMFVLPAGMEFGHVFKTELKNKYDLRDLNGKRTFFAMETLEESNEYPSQFREVDITLLGVSGGKICEITGSERGYNVKTENRDLGTFKNHGNEIIVKNEEGTELLKVVRLIVKNRMEYKVLDYKTNAFVGHIKPTWVTNDEVDEDKSGVHVVMPDMFGVQYDKQMNTTTKTLLVCLMLVLFYKYTEPVDFGNNKKKFVVGILFNMAVGTILLIMVLIIVLTILLKTDPLPIIKDNTTNVTTTPTMNRNMTTALPRSDTTTRPIPKTTKK